MENCGSFRAGHWASLQIRYSQSTCSYFQIRLHTSALSVLKQSKDQSLPPEESSILSSKVIYSCRPVLAVDIEVAGRLENTVKVAVFLKELEYSILRLRIFPVFGCIYSDGYPKYPTSLYIIHIERFCHRLKRAHGLSLHLYNKM